LVIENPTTRVSYQLEVGIMEDGRLCGQLTPDDGGTGPDALVLFDTTPEVAQVSGNRGGAALRISVNEEKGPEIISEPKHVTTLGFS
jgi:hypothetical protein